MYRLGKAQERLDELQKQVTQEILFSLNALRSGGGFGSIQGEPGGSEQGGEGGGGEVDEVAGGRRLHLGWRHNHHPRQTQHLGLCHHHCHNHQSHYHPHRHHRSHHHHDQVQPTMPELKDRRRTVARLT